MESFSNKGQSNLAKGDIARLIMTTGTAPSCLVFYHIRQVAAHVPKMVLGEHLGPPIWGEGNRVESTMVLFERAMVVFYRLSIMTIVLSLTIRPQFAIEFLRRSKGTGVGHFGTKFAEE